VPLRLQAQHRAVRELAAVACSLVKGHPPPGVVWLQTSHADPLSYGAANQFLYGAHAPMAVHAAIFKDAGHRISVWTDVLPRALEWVGKNDRGFSPRNRAIRFWWAPPKTAPTALKGGRATR
jgi:hypothetical protein